MFLSGRRQRDLPDFSSQSILGTFVDHRTRKDTGLLISHDVTSQHLPRSASQRGNQVTDSENHPEWRFGTPSSDSGGPFMSQSKWISLLNNRQYAGSKVTLGSFDKHEYNYSGHILLGLSNPWPFPYQIRDQTLS